MQEFFKGWRRKAGCVSLVVACVYAAGWVRSDFSFDKYIWSGFSNGYAIYSHEGRFGCRYWGSGDPQGAPIEADYLRDALRTDDEWQAFFELVSAKEVSSPYWCVVTPLIAISAYLLLGKPRPTKPQSERPV